MRSLTYDELQEIIRRDRPGWRLAASREEFEAREALRRQQAGAGGGDGIVAGAVFDPAGGGRKRVVVAGGRATSAQG